MSNSKHQRLEGSRYNHDDGKEEENSLNQGTPQKTLSTGGIGWAEEIRQRAREALNQ